MLEVNPRISGAGETTRRATTARAALRHVQT
jgi:hypothetical protein